jgi:hypothetical protein
VSAAGKTVGEALLEQREGEVQAGFKVRALI